MGADYLYIYTNCWFVPVLSVVLCSIEADEVVKLLHIASFPFLHQHILDLGGQHLTAQYAVGYRNT